MRTNRIGNLKRFFGIEETMSVLDVCSAFTDDGQKYDYIFWNPSETLYDETKDLRDISAKDLFILLSETGKLVIYFDNPAGVHAFAQGLVCEENNCVGYAFLKEQIKHLDAYEKWYYPYPTVEFPAAFYSDDRLPHKNECDDNFYHFERARMEAFDEREVTDRLVACGMYPYMAHAYMVILSKKPIENYPIYTRFSNERRADRQIRTDLYFGEVRKSAVGEKAAEHIAHMQTVEQPLRKVAAEIDILGKVCDVNKIISTDKEKGILTFEYVNGKSLEQILDEWLEQGKESDVSDVLLSTVNQLRQNTLSEPFDVTDAFKNVFGDIQNIREYAHQYDWKTLPVSNIDFVCQNILVGERAVVIDYEWTFDFPVPVDFLVFRFLYFYLEAKNRECANADVLTGIYEKAGITEELKDLFFRMETHFQHYVQHGARVLCNSYDEAGKAVLTRNWIDRYLEKLDQSDAQYFKDGVYVYKLSSASNGECVSLNGFAASDDRAKVLRIGAMEDVNGEHIGLSFETNGRHLGGLLYLFENCVPQIMLGSFTKAEISVEEIEMSKAAVEELKTTISDMRFIIDNREQQIADLKNSASWKVTKPLRMLRGNKEE